MNHSVTKMRWLAQYIILNNETYIYHILSEFPEGICSPCQNPPCNLKQFLFIANEFLKDK